MKQEPIFVIRAYCSKCKKLLMESVAMTRKQLMASWDKAVFDAPGIACKDCETKVPNFDLELKIYNKGTKKEYKPEFLLPKPTDAMDTLAKVMFNK